MDPGFRRDDTLLLVGNCHGVGAGGDDVVDEAEFFGVFGRHEIVALHCFFDDADFLVAMFDVNLVEALS